MSADTQRSRRALLLGSLGAAAAVIARPLAALAATDDDTPMLVGHQYTTGETTKLDATGNSVNPFWVVTGGDPAIRATANGTGVIADGSATGVDGTGSVGVYGHASTESGATGIGVAGESAGTGVSGSGATGVAGFGDVYGVAGYGATGVYGESESGPGVFGLGATGVRARSYGGGIGVDAVGTTAVRAASSTGVGIKAVSGQGFAAWLDGALRIDRAAGQVVFPKGAQSRTVPVSVPVSKTTVAIASVNGAAVQGVGVREVVLQVGGHQLTIWLTIPAPAAVSVGWLVISKVG